ncbi:MAG: FAD-dependent oxidoreductase [Acidimicrobiales bacterium]
MPTERASVVVIGAGIVGNFLAHHLAKLGWRDIVLIDKGPMPNPGGSTGHASNFIYPIEYSKMMMELTAESSAQYKELGVFVESGGLEVARTNERMEELRRRLAAAKAWGIPAELVTPRKARELVPYLNEKVIIGALYLPTVGVVDSLRAGTLVRDRTVADGSLTVEANTEVLAIDVDETSNRVRTVRTSRGEIETDYVAICCGVWSPRIARMAGARIALVPTVHQMISVGPIPMFSETSGEIEFPIVRDMDPLMYERQHGADLEVGSYAHRPILVDPDDIPPIEKAALSPTELPFTQEDFDPQLAEALELMPDVLDDERVGVRHAINGLISMTPDGHPVLGECPETNGLWSVAASWIKEGPGIARAVAEWMSGHAPETDIHEADIARFYDAQKTRAHVAARAAEGFNKIYGIVHPMEQWESDRPVRVSPFYERQCALGAVFYETAGWERPYWYASNEALIERYSEKVVRREAEWDSRWWSPIISAEHLATRDGVGIVDLSAFAMFEVGGPGALESVQRTALAQMDVPVGRVVYTPILNERGTFVADLTIMRLGEERFRVVTGGATGNMDRRWFGRHLVGDAQVFDVTSSWSTLGIWGPNARRVVAQTTADDVSHEGFAFATCRSIEIDGVAVLASRISYIGELGWELHIPMEQGARVWDVLFEAGQPFGVVPAGLGVYLVTGRLEKAYRAYGAELTADFNVVEAGMQRPKVKEADFVGKDAHLAHREDPQAALLCTLTIDDHRASDGRKRFPLGGEPILERDGGRLVDAHGRGSYVTSAGSGPSVGKHILLAYLPHERAIEGAGYAVEYMGERLPVTVVTVGSRPLFDPDNERVRS